MAYTNCIKDGRQHNWDYWYPIAERVLESGVLGPLTYERRCQNMGCASFERAESLSPSGRFEKVEAHHNAEGKVVLETE